MTELTLHQLLSRASVLARDAADLVQLINRLNAESPTAGLAASSDLVMLRGADNIRLTLEAAVSQSATEVLAAQPSARRSPELLREAIDRELPLLARGVKLRMVYPHTARVDANTLAYAEVVGHAGAEIRTVVEVFERLIVVDDRMAFIPTGTDRADEALEIRHQAVVAFLRRVFEQWWQQSTPLQGELFGPRSAEILVDTEQEIMKRLVAGETDKAIGKALNMHERTVWQHINRVSRRLGAGSRAQLCYLIGVRDLLGGADPPT